MAESKRESFTFFYGKNSPFSQHYRVDFNVAGVVFCCAEQYMMHQKARLFNDEEIAERIMETNDPRKHKALGRKVRGFNEVRWREQCLPIVREANKAKFTQNPALLASLMATKGTTLVEASPRDTIWGIGLSAENPKALRRETWRGTNLLGQILTELRDEIDNECTR
eukprot:Em0011g13a